MDFQLNDEQLHLNKSVREFAEREIAPNVRKWDDAAEFPLATIKEIGKLGLMGVIFPPELGGVGMGYVEYVTAIEELVQQGLLTDHRANVRLTPRGRLLSNEVFERFISATANG